MCDIGKALGRAFTPAGTGALEAQLQAQQDAAGASSDAAAKALTDAIAATKKADVPAIDNPSARAAGMTQMQKLLAAQGNTWSFGNSPVGAPTVATKVLMGE